MLFLMSCWSASRLMVVVSKMFCIITVAVSCLHCCCLVWSFGFFMALLLLIAGNSLSSYVNTGALWLMVRGSHWYVEWSFIDCVVTAYFWLSALAYVALAAVVGNLSRCLGKGYSASGL